MRRPVGVFLTTLAVGGAVLSGCSGDTPGTRATSATAHTPQTTHPIPTAAQSTTPRPQPPAPRATIPLAVVTGITNLKATISVRELRTLAGRGDLVLPCGIRVDRPVLAAGATCVDGQRIAGLLGRNQSRIALLPPGLVQPATKVLSIRGTGPFGMFGPDLFGDARARALDYPVMGSPLPGTSPLDASWLAHDASQMWTLTNVGSLCSDRGGAIQAVTEGKGWGWVLGGGTARYAGRAVVDPPNREPYLPVQPVDTGNDGATAQVLKRSDVAIADHECPVVPDRVWRPQLGRTAVFSVPEEVLEGWRRTLGLDAVYLAANHMSDKGVDGIRSTLDLLDKHRIPRTGLGMTLDEALEPAYVDVAGQTVAFVAFNDVPGVAEADADTPGVAWITRRNIDEGVRRAKRGGADLVICTPQWWGGAEYHDDLWPTQGKQLRWFDQAGCDHVIGSGTHVAGPLLLRGPSRDMSAVLASPGNYLFGQGWWQETQEGVILDLTFRGTTLVNVRLRPTVMIQQARPALLDPEGDGRYVLERVWKYSTVAGLR